MAGIIGVVPNIAGGLGIEVEPSSVVLSRIIIGPGQRGCSHGGGPTIRLVGGIVTRGGGGGLDRGSCCRCGGCRGVAVSLGSIAPRVLRGNVCGGVPFLGSRVRLYRRAGGFVLPVSISRATSRGVCHGRPGDRGAVVGKVDSAKIGRLFTAKSVLDAILGSMFASIGVCSGSVHLLRCPFVDPVSSDSTVSFCGFCVVSAAFISGSGYFRLAFIPGGSRSFNFAKRLCMLTSSSCAIGGYAVGLPGGSKIGFMSGVSVVRRFRRLPGKR